jgi:hypothetical protein
MTEIIRTESRKAHGLILIENESVWITFSSPWWNVFEQIRWFLTKGKERVMLLKIDNENHRVRVRAKRIAKTFARIG